MKKLFLSFLLILNSQVTQASYSCNPEAPVYCFFGICATSLRACGTINPGWGAQAFSSVDNNSNVFQNINSIEDLLKTTSQEAYLEAVHFVNSEAPSVENLSNEALKIIAEDHLRLINQKSQMVEDTK
jgi:hypothetical protein